MAQIAQDTFIAVLKDGTERMVTKGEVLPDSHELVKRDASGVLFRKLDIGEEPQPQMPARARAAKMARKAP